MQAGPPRRTAVSAWPDSSRRRRVRRPSSSSRFPTSDAPKTLHQRSPTRPISEPMRCSCKRHHTSTPNASGSSASPRSTGCRPVTSTGTSPTLAASCRTGPNGVTCFAASRSSWTRSSRARSPPTYRSSYRRSSSWSSTSRPRRPWASRSRRRCSRGRMKSFNDGPPVFPIRGPVSRHVGRPKDWRVASMTYRGLSPLAVILVGCFIVPSGLPLWAQGGPPAGYAPVDAEGLAHLAPRLDSRRADIKSFEVKGSLTAGGVMTFHCVSAAPRRACVVLVDQVPIFVASGEDVFLYDALSGPHLWRADWRVFFGMVDDVVRLQHEVLTLGHSNAGVVIDLAGLLERASEGRTVTEIGGPRYRLTSSTPSGGHLEAWVDLSRAGRYSRLTAQPAWDSKPLLDVSIVSVDEPIDPRAFVFPRFADHVSLPSPSTEMTAEGGIQAGLQMVTELFLHWGRADPTVRPELERKLGRSLDWSDLQQREATMAPLLRRAIETDSTLRPP